METGRKEAVVGVENAAAADVRLVHLRDERTRSVPRGLPLMDFVREEVPGYAFPCSGNHTCGKCRVLVEGEFPPPSLTETRLLRGRPGRLACFLDVPGDCRIELVDAAAEAKILTAITATDHLNPTYAGRYGAAVDIGTTTVVAYLFERSNPSPVAVTSALNAQLPFGADVLSRIAYCNEHGVRHLHRLKGRQLNQMLRELATHCEGGDTLSGLTVCGNTVMQTILAGLEPRSLAEAPFTPPSLFGDYIDLRLHDFPGLAAYLAPSVSAYIGGDITCSMLASGIAERDDACLLVDIGTNGEMALKTADGIRCCSTAAGPAFEGAGLSCGAPARGGAVDRVFLTPDGVGYTTIDGGPATGICGSGILDTISVMRELDVLDASGRMDRRYDKTYPLGDSAVSVSQHDVRMLQLAKGAVRAGMDSLVREADLEYEDLSEIILCGGFGSFLDPGSAAEIGLIPPSMRDRTRAIGNAAGGGAGRMLQNRADLTKAQEIARSATTLELSFSEYFRHRYLEAMRLE